jgi:SPP1 family predicted phage head-tail adaptor
MRAGKLFHPITIYEPLREDDDYGGGKENLMQFAKSRAAIIPLKGVETVVDGKLTMVVRFTIIMRYVPDVSPKMVVEMDNGRMLEILTIKNIDEKNKQIDLLCKEYG